MQIGKEKFIAAVKNFMRMYCLTAPLLRELIDRIDVYEVTGTGKNRTQRITIHYRSIGALEIPEARHYKHLKLDTRQGVAVEYLPNTATA